MGASAAIYCRISRDKTGQEAGVERQERACRELAETKGYRVVQVFTDNDISAYSGKPRPGFRALLRGMAAGDFDVLLCWHVDRLYRSLKDLDEIINAVESGGTEVRTVNSGDIDLSRSTGKMVARILGSITQQESEHHAERRREANKARALSGQWCSTGSRPFGFNNDGTHREPEASMIRDATRSVLSGTSLHQIARQWNASQVTTVRGVRWSNLHVRRVLSNPRVAALRVHRKEIVGKGNWEPIVEDRTWRGLQVLLGDPSRRKGIAFERRYLLSGIARCGVCGGPLYASHPHGRDRRMAYTCRPSGHLGRNGAALDELVETVVIAYLTEHGLGADLRIQLQIDTRALEARRQALLETKGDLAGLLRRGVLDVVSVEREAQGIDAEVVEIDRQLADVMAGHPLARLLLTEGESPSQVDADDLVQRWSQLSPDVKGKIIGVLLDVVVNPAPHGQRVFDPDLIDLQWKL